MQRSLELRATGGIGLHAARGEPRRERIDRAAYLIELADARGIEPRHFKAAAAALGDEALPVQQVQRMARPAGATRPSRSASSFCRMRWPGSRLAVDDGFRESAHRPGQ